MEMSSRQPERFLNAASLSCELTKDLAVLSRRVLRYANREVSRIDFMRALCGLVIEFSGCDAAELRTEHDALCYRCDARLQPKEAFKFETNRSVRHDGSGAGSGAESDMDRLCAFIFRGLFDSSRPFFTRNGSFWTGDTDIPFEITLGEGSAAERICLSDEYQSLAIIPFIVDEQNFGLMILKSLKKYFFAAREVEIYEGVAQTLGVGVSCRRAQAARHERVKELTCLYNIVKVVERPGISLDGILRGIIEMLPPAWQYPEMAFARIALDGRAYSSPGFRDSEYKLVTEIVVDEERRGTIEITYADEGLAFKEEPFLKEERSLLDAVAREVEVVVEMKEAEAEKAHLQDQLRHADRLATIGQFAAGVAHELNEPLGKILGFAQLAKKCQALPAQAAEDLDKIINASLNARETVRKLLIFTRQMPKKQTNVDMNKIITEELHFFESQCAKDGIKLVRRLEPKLPPMEGDPVQLHQVLVNLVVNAIQAMPGGGTLSVGTRSADGSVYLVVEDTGIGMSNDVQKKIFLPFFTTKDVGKGTGLGLSVVHGIVTSHGGEIGVESRAGRGSRFEIKFPITKQPGEQAG